MFQLSAGHLAQLRARPPRVMRLDAPETESGGVSLHHVPNPAFADAVTPTFFGSADTPEEFARVEFGGTNPCVYGRFDPVRQRHGPDVPAFAHQIDNRPLLLSLL